MSILNPEALKCVIITEEENNRVSELNMRNGWRGLGSDRLRKQEKRGGVWGGNHGLSGCRVINY